MIAYNDDAPCANFASTFGGSDEGQWRAAAEALHIWILVSYTCGYSLSDTRCDHNPSQQHRYLGIIRGSETASFLVPEDKLRKLHVLIEEVIAEGSVTARATERIAWKRVRTSVVIRPASLWTHYYMVAVIKKAKGNKLRLSDKPG